MSILIAFALLLIVAAAAVAGIVYGGLIDVAATASEPGPLRWLLETTREQAVRRRAADIVVPTLSDPGRASAGAAAFDAMCAGCHGAPGQEPGEGRQDMNPAPPRLAEAVTGRRPQELFWVVKNGLRMTGMPAWGPTHPDRALWDIVAFLERLPGLSADDYREWVAHGTGGRHGHTHAH